MQVESYVKVNMNNNVNLNKDKIILNLINKIEMRLEGVK